MSTRRDQYICAALVRQPYNPNVTAEETAKCIVRLADATIAAAGETPERSLRQAAYSTVQAELARQQAAEIARLKRMLEPLTDDEAMAAVIFWESQPGTESDIENARQWEAAFTTVKNKSAWRRRPE